MKNHPILLHAKIIEATDEFYDEVHFVWRQVPKFWVGDFVQSHSFKIRSAT